MSTEQVVGHYSFTATTPYSVVEKQYEKALKKILKARQLAHAKSIAKEALEDTDKG